MNSRITQLTRTSITRWGAALLVALLAVFCTVSVASAHDELIGSDPETGSTVSASPEKITLEFSGELQNLAGAQTSVVALSDKDGTKIQTEATTKGTKVTVVPANELSNGTYKLAYRVASSDGHPIENSIEFTVDAPVVDSPSASVSPSATAPAITSPEATVQPSADASGSPQPVQELGAKLGPIGWVIVGIVIIGAAVAVLVKFTRQNK